LPRFHSKLDIDKPDFSKKTGLLNHLAQLFTAKQKFIAFGTIEG